MLSLDEYNSLMETVHLLKSRSNVNRLFESIQQADEEKFAPEISISEL